MIRRNVMIQLVAFAVISVAAVGFLLFRFAGLGELFHPAYQIRAHFADAGGIYPRAAVDLLGTPVGTVDDVAVAATGDVVVTLRINHGVRIPVDVTASVANRSAIGEQYVALTPRSGDGPLLGDGSVIPISRTATPLPVRELLGNLNALAASVPREALATNLTEVADAFGGTGADLQRLLDQSNAFTRTNLANLNDLIGLIDTGSTVLNTQLAKGPQVRAFSRDLAGLTDQLRVLDPTFAEAFDNGIQAAHEVTGLLRDNEEALPALLTNLRAITDVAFPRQQQLRKTLVVLPWSLERVHGAIRYCDENDLKTGQPIPSTCHYDSHGQRQYRAKFALQLIEKTVISDPYNVCTRGYQDTKKFHPNGAPANGAGPHQRPDQPANREARCTAPPTDPDSPLVRGAQNAQRPDRAPPTRAAALYNPNSGFLATPNGPTYHITVVSGPPPPTGPGALPWLLTQPMSKGR